MYIYIFRFNRVIDLYIYIYTEYTQIKQHKSPKRLWFIPFTKLRFPTWPDWCSPSFSKRSFQVKISWSIWPDTSCISMRLTESTACIWAGCYLVHMNLGSKWVEDSGSKEKHVTLLEGVAMLQPFKYCWWKTSCNSWYAKYLIKRNKFSICQLMHDLFSPYLWQCEALHPSV